MFSMFCVLFLLKILVDDGQNLVLKACFLMKVADSLYRRNTCIYNRQKSLINLQIFKQAKKWLKNQITNEP